MKNYLFLFIFLGLTFISCDRNKHKPQDNASTSNDNGRNKFKDTLVVNSTPNYNEIFAAHCSSSYNFYVVQKLSGSQYNLYKCDEDIRLLVSKTIDLGPDQLLNIIGSKRGDSFYTHTATNNFNSSNAQFINAYVVNNYNIDSAKNCTPVLFDYIYDDAFNSAPENRLTNYSTINRFDGDGNLLWTRQLDGNSFNGSSLETDKDGNLYVLTANRCPITPKINYTYTNSPVPYYDFVTDSNSFSIYKFDLQGIQLFKKTITHVKNTNWQQFDPSLVVSKTNITIANTNNLYIFDFSGNLLTQTKPLSNSCYSYINSIVSNPSINQTYINGTINYNASNNNMLGYLATFNNTSPSIISQSTNLSYNFLVTDNLANIYIGGNFINSLSKLSSTGNYIYAGKPIYDQGPFSLIKKATLVDGNNALYGFINRQTEIVVYKFDNNGSYN